MRSIRSSDSPNWPAEAGRFVASTRADSKFTQYTLDPEGQVKAETQWDSKTGTARQYQVLAAYDPGGNRIEKFQDGDLETQTYGDSGQILTAGSDTFTFDQFLNMKTKVSGGATTTYSWDFESNLIGIDFPNTANDDSHEYDGMGRRMRSKFAGAANWTNYVWDEVAGTLLAEYTQISGTFTIKSENTWGLGLISTNRETTKRYFHFDGLGNTIALTDSSENITDTYGYTVSGTSVSSEDSGSSVNPFRWLGRAGAYSDGAVGSATNFIQLRSWTYSSVLFTPLQPQRRQQNPFCLPSAENPRITPLFPPPPGVVPGKGFPKAGATCKEWNEAIYRYCHRCYSDPLLSDPNCRHICNNLADWYYRSCKDQFRTRLPGSESWIPCPDDIVPIPYPSPSPSQTALQNCLEKAKTDWERSLCWAAYVLSTIMENPPW